MFVSPSSTCAATFPISLQMTVTSSSPSAADANALIIPVCSYSTSTNISIACFRDHLQQSVTPATTRCGSPAVISGSSGVKMTCRAVYHAWNGADGVLSSSSAISFLIPSPPINFELSCIRNPRVSFAWLPPPSPPPYYVAVMIVSGTVLGRQRVMSGTLFERLSVTWTLPAAAQWVATCVSSVYVSDFCQSNIRNASNITSSGSFTSKPLVSTTCPDSPQVDLSDIESDEPLDIVRNDAMERSCFSMWVCACARGDVDAPKARGVMNNATHVAVDFADVASQDGVRAAEVMCCMILSCFDCLRISLELTSI
jgi:hypothetical protein